MYIYTVYVYILKQYIYIKSMNINIDAYTIIWIPTLDLYETLASWDIKIGQGIGLPSLTWVDYNNTWDTSWHLRTHSTFLAIPLGAASEKGCLFLSFLLLTEAPTDLPRSELALQCITTHRKWCINSSCKLIDRCANRQQTSPFSLDSFMWSSPV